MLSSILRGVSFIKFWVAIARMTINIHKKLEQARNNVKSKLKTIDVFSVEQAKDILARYTAGIEGNFVQWMGAAVIYARSPQGKYAATENLDVEVKENHPAILREFAKSAKAEPSLEHYQAVDAVVASMRTLIASGNGLEALTVMATIENTSTAFVPYLAGLAKKRGSTNLHYTHIHGEADVEHARQFVWAVEHELKQHDDAEKKIDLAINKTLHYLNTILS